VPGLEEEEIKAHIFSGFDTFFIASPANLNRFCECRFTRAMVLIKSKTSVSSGGGMI
jgi:hypothetical protein